MPQPNNKKPLEDDKYKSATKEVVDDAMRVDNIAPVIQQAINTHRPLNEQIKTLVVDEVLQKNTDAEEAMVKLFSKILMRDDAKEAVVKVVENNEMIKKRERSKVIKAALISAASTLADPFWPEL